MKSFLIAAGERAGRAAAAALMSLWVVGDHVFSLVGVDWGSSLGVAGGAAVVSLLLSVVGSNVGDKGDPSLVK